VSETKGIYAALLEVQKKVGAIEKNGKGPSQKGGFSYIKAEDITDKVHSLLNEFGVITVPRIQYANHEVVRDGSRSYITATLSIEYDYICVADGSMVTVSSVGEGSDIGSDTATRKAATQALKISHLHLFSIPNSEYDDEGYGPADNSTAEKAPNRAVAAATKAKAPAGGGNVDKLRAEIKVAARDKGLTSDALNKMGQEISEDFFNEAPALATLLEKIKKG
jgi:hypothetical protein